MKVMSRSLYNKIANSFRKASFGKSFLILVSGQSVSRLIPIITVPILTRLYLPRDFGLHELFMTMLTFINAVSSGYYEAAIILPAENWKAAALRKLSISLACVFSVFCFWGFLFFKRELVEYAQNPNASYFLVLVPLMVVLNTALQAQYQWAIRNSFYKILTTSYIVNTVFSTLFEILFGFVGFTGIGLILGSNLGNFSGLLFITFAMNKKVGQHGSGHDKQVRFGEMLSVSKEYIDFPKFQMLGAFINKGVSMLPTLFFTKFFTPDFVGYYGLSKKLLGVPATVISQSAGNVFAGKAAREYLVGGECSKTYRKTLFLLLFISVPLFSMIFFIGPPVFPVVLGEEWREAGWMLRVLVPQYFFAFISSPFYRMYSISKKLRRAFLWQLSLFILSILVLYLGTRLFKAHTAVLFFALGYSFMYVVNIILTYRLSQGQQGTSY